MIDVIAMLPRRNPRERLRIAREVYQGISWIDLRVAVKLSEAADIYTPTKTGVSFPPDDLAVVIEALQQLQAAEGAR